MPIRGLTTLTERAASFPIIGTIRKGAPKPNEKQPGRDLTHFRFTAVDPAAATLFQNNYGDKPTEIRVYLPFPTADENFSTWQEEWVAGGLVHRCDGVECVLWYDKQAGGYSQQRKPCPGGCKQVGRLSVVIREFQRLALVTVLTTSKHDIMELWGNLTAAQVLRPSGLTGIPFVLCRRPRMISTPSGPNGQRARREKHLLTIEPDPAWVQHQLAAMQRAATPGLAPAPSRRLIAAPATAEAPPTLIDIDTGEVVDPHGLPTAEDFGEDEYDEAETVTPTLAPVVRPPASAAPIHDLFDEANSSASALPPSRLCGNCQRAEVKESHIRNAPERIAKLMREDGLCVGCASRKAALQAPPVRGGAR